MKIFGPPLLTSCLLWTAGCSTTPALQNYAERAIDRGYTLPAGLSTWRTLLTASFTPNENSWSAYPWYWEQAVNPKLTLVWYPLPFELRYEFFHHERRRLGFLFNILGAPYYRSGDFNWSPTIELNDRHFLSQNWAWDLNFLALLELRRSDHPAHGLFALDTGPWFQLADQIGLGPTASVWIEWGAPRSRYIGPLPPDPAKSPSVRIPLGTKASWIPFRQWEVEAQYRWLAGGYPEPYRSHQLLISVIHIF